MAFKVLATPSLKASSRASLEPAAWTAHSCCVVSLSWPLNVSVAVTASLWSSFIRRPSLVIVLVFLLMLTRSQVGPSSLRVSLRLQKVRVSLSVYCTLATVVKLVRASQLSFLMKALATKANGCANV
jgi:hypothetical protein